MKTNFNKKLLALLLVFTMIFACSTSAMTPVYADDATVTTTAAPNTVTIRVEQLGQTDLVPTVVEFTEGQNALELLKTIATVTEGTPMGDAAFITGINNYPADDSGISWMFKVNGMAPVLENGYSAAANQYMVKPGDKIEFYSINFADGTAYAKFDKSNYSTTVNTTLTVRLTKEVFDANWVSSQTVAEGATILVSEKDADKAATETMYVTNESGLANIMFTEAGTYIISAKQMDGDKQLLARPYAKVTVTESTMNEINIITLNDFHGNLMESGKNIGMVKMVGYINGLKASNPNTMVVSAGDNYQGSALSNLTYGAPVNDMFKALDVVASAVGNHEFDWGSDRIANWGKQGGFPFLAANICDKTTGEPVSWAKPYIIREVDGVKIAFIGLTTVESAHTTKAENVANIEFKAVDEAAKTWVDYLKAGKDAAGVPDVIIALTHVPSFQDYESKVVSGDELDALTKVEGLDAVISGHSHKTVAGEMNGVPVVQAYKYGRSVGTMTLALDENKKVVSITPSVEAVYKLSSDLVKEDAGAKETLDTYNKKFEPIINEVVGKVDGDLLHSKESDNLTKLGYFTCDVMRKAANVQIGITNGGGLRTDILAGNVTMGNLYEVMPFDNTLYTMKVTGQELWQIIDHGISAPDMGDGQFAGVKIVYDPAKEYGNKLVKLSLEDGTMVEMDKEYTIVVNDFMATGGDKYDFSRATDKVNTFVPIRDGLVNAFKAVDMVHAPNIEGLVMQGIATPTTNTYLIQPGDVLWRIAAKYNTTIQELGKLNNLENLNLIIAGENLLVPSK